MREHSTWHAINIWIFTQRTLVLTAEEKKRKNSFNFKMTEAVLAMGPGGKVLSFYSQRSLPTSHTDHSMGNRTSIKETVFSVA